MRIMLPAILLVAWLTTTGSCDSSSTTPDASGVAGKGNGGAAGGRAGSGGAAGTVSPGSGGGGGACTQCPTGQTCCYDRTGKVQCLPAGAVCTG